MNEIARNGFSGKLAYALWFWSNSQGAMSGNDFSGNSIGIGGSRLDIATANNRWGTTDPAEICAPFVGDLDGTGSGIVSFAPFAAEPFGLDTP
jgi:hypothetical protein